jgi:membrane-bound lytic murein transglycosylase D
MIKKSTLLVPSVFFVMVTFMQACTKPPHNQEPAITEAQISLKAWEDSLRGLWSACWELVAQENWEDAYTQACSLSNLPELDSLGEFNPDLAELHRHNYSYILAQCLPHLDLQGLENAGEVLEYDFAQRFGDLDTSIMDSATKGLLPLIDTTGYDIPITVNHLVLNCIRYFQTTARTPFTLWLSRMQYYVPKIDSQLKAMGAPITLRYLALIESGFNPKAYSRAHASGLWQFIAATGKRYGLMYDYWIDERRNPEKSTRAGVRYLTDLYHEFGDWKLALASYNCGENRIRTQIRKKGIRDYWVFDLPRQTKLYVPLFFAASIIARTPATFGFSVPPFPPVMETDAVLVQDCLDLHRAADFAGCSYETLKQMNLELRQWCTPPGKRTFVLNLPRGTKERFAEGLAKTPREKFIQWHQHTIRRGETISTIARAYGLSIAHLKEANNLTSNIISIGKHLLIPLPHNATVARRPEAAAEPAAASRAVPRPPPLSKNALEKIPAGKNRITYEIKSGDNLWDISARFGISVEELLAWNGLRRRQNIFAGQRLSIYLDGGSPKTGVSSTSPNPALKKESLPLPGSGGKSYTVKFGDNLYRIARFLQVPQDSLSAWNRLSGRENLMPGQKLTYYGDAKPSGLDLQIYVVRTGDTLWEIARRYGTTVEKIVVLNNIKDNRIQLGDKILIPDKKG